MAKANTTKEFLGQPYVLHIETSINLLFVNCSMGQSWLCNLNLGYDILFQHTSLKLMVEENIYSEK